MNHKKIAISLIGLALLGCSSTVQSPQVSTVSDVAETPYFGRLNTANHTFPNTCGEVYETNVNGSGCDLTYRILRASYNYEATRCTDLVVVSQNANCAARYTLPMAGATIRKCADGTSFSYGGTRNIVNWLLRDSAGLDTARNSCQTALRESSIAFEKFDTVYQAYQERLNSFGRDLVINTLEGLAGHLLDNSQFSDGIKQVINQIIATIVAEVREGGMQLVDATDLERILEGEAKTRIIDAVKDFAKRNLPEGTPDLIIDMLAEMTVEEIVDQAKKAARGEGIDGMQVLGSLADRASDMMIGAIASVGDKFGLGGVLATELQLLKSQLTVLGSSIPYFQQAAATRQVCDNYVTLFNTAGAGYAAQVQQCVRRVRSENATFDQVLRDSGL